MKFFAILFSGVLISSPSSAVSAKKVVVIGAGLAGLTAAYELSKNPSQYDVSIYEAKNRPGGRIFTVYLNGKPSELGAENILDGGDALTVRRLVKEMGLKIRVREIPPADSYFLDRSTGERYLRSSLVPYFPQISKDEMKKTLIEAEAHSKNLSEVIDYFFEKYKSSDAETTKKRKLIREIVETSERSYEGGEMKDLSTRYAHGSLPDMMKKFLPSTAKPSSHTKDSIRGGNSQLILALSKKLGKKLRLESPLIEMNRNAEGQLELSFGGFAGKVQADIVIMAIPGKPYRNIKFGEKTLEKSFIDKVSSIGYGTHAKILVPIAKPKTSLNFNSPEVLVWGAPDEAWGTFYFSGAAGVMKDQNELKAGYDLGASAMGSDFELAKDPQIVIPTKILSKNSTSVAMSWATDPYIQASYSFYNPHTKDDLEKTIEMQGEQVLPLFAPVMNQIFFAGEHTTVDQDIRGTMEAAADSGARAARLVQKLAK